MRFTSRQRLRRTAEYQAVRASGLRIDCGTFLFSILLREPSDDRRPVRRLGVIASKRVGDAVRRNFCKRRLREVFRLHQRDLPDDCDVVLIARRTLIHEPFDQTEKRFRKACQRFAPRPGSRQSDDA